MNEFVFKNQKKLRCGLTTGTCAAACAQAAMLHLLTGQVRSEVSVRLPESRKTIRVGASAEHLVTLSVYPTEDGGFATRKDAGDDPDVTNGTEIRAYVKVCEKGPEETATSSEEELRLHADRHHSEMIDDAREVRMESHASSECFGPAPEVVPEGAFVSADGRLYLSGGEGVGRVTKPGLEQAVGQSAINRVPRQMIFDAVQQVLAEFEDDEKTCYLITISVPAGAALATRTFNPMLGIEGGISILGTTGIVEPMSEAAIVATIETSIRQTLALEETAGSGRKDDGSIGPERKQRILAVPGNYGQRYAEQNLGLRGVPTVEVSNYIGEAIDLAISYGATEFLLVGNIGKLVKLAAGIMNTHSRVADGRWEIFAAHLALCGGTQAQVAAMREATTTEEMLTRLEEMGMRESVMASIMKEIEVHLRHRIRGQMDFGVIVYSERFGRVGETAGVARLLEGFRETNVKRNENES